MKEIKILAPCGMLGYGFPLASFVNGMKVNPQAIVVDAGSTDAGPHKLGAGVGIVSRRATKKDIAILLEAGLSQRIPVIIGSAGGAGARPHVEWTIAIIKEILEEKDLKAKMAVIWADFSSDAIIEAHKEGKIKKMSSNVPDLSAVVIKETNSIVAQMGHEPILEALQNQCDIILCGRSFDPSPFAAIGIHYGMDIGLSYHLGKILECGALCAEPGTAKDCIIGTLKEHSFTVEATNPLRKCTAISVSAHTFYEKDHPYLLQGPGFILDLSQCLFTEVGNGRVEVRNSKYEVADEYYVKLEGARRVAYRTFCMAGVRDPLFISQIETIEQIVKKQVAEYYQDIHEDRYSIIFLNYGKNAVLGNKEIERFTGYEIGVLFEVVADTQELATSICGSVRSTLLHYGYEGRKSTAGNLAFPYAPSDIEFGAVYEFSIYHLMKIGKEEQPFEIEYFWR